MNNLTASDKSILERLFSGELARLDKITTKLDNSSELQILEMAEKLYLSNDYINEIKININGGPY